MNASFSRVPLVSQVALSMPSSSLDRDRPSTDSSVDESSQYEGRTCARLFGACCGCGWHLLDGGVDGSRAASSPEREPREGSGSSEMLLSSDESDACFLGEF